ncbi:MAG: hypothetical protein IJ588_08610 [Prevotella sp.]|nr:hypothetical protein [Prevotella sp.]
MKKSLISGVAALALGFAIVGCSSHDDYNFEQAKQADYAKAFEKEFGKVATNQNWGFTDQNAGTRSANVNRNEWGTGNGNGGHVAVPENVTPDERTLVFNYFNKKREGAINENNVLWTDFFITEVWKGEDVYKDGYENNVKGSDQMNHLQVLKGEGYIDDKGALQGDWEHANDFNNGNHYSEYNTIKGHTYMENSGTLDFAYHNTSDSKYHNEYIIIPGAEIDASLAGYYYVGFDFYAHGTDIYPANKNMDVERDWVFTDWIVRISPAEFLGSQRVFVEDIITSTDLSNVSSSDWDFNDAVFDAYIKYNESWKDGNYAVITLRAAGGTLPLTIAGREVHELFGVSQETMVNTGAAGGAEVAPVQFRLTKDEIVSANANDIKVVVTDAKGQKIELTAKVGQATQKVAAPVENHVKWLKERNHIKNGYPTFEEYVGDATKVWYEPAVEDYLYQKWF